MSLRDAFLERACLHEIFETQADRTPDAVAVVFGDTCATYRELDQQSNRLASRLIRLGARREALIGLCVERSVELVVGMLGILKAGAAYIPLDPSYPPDRLAFMLADADAPLLVTQEYLVASLWRKSRADIVCLDRDREWISSESDIRLTNRTTSESLAYAIYTSGSTGRPKAAMVTHRSVVNVLAWLQDRHPLGPEDAIVQRIPFAFDGSVCDFYWPFLAGARLILLGSEEHRDPECVAQVVEEQRGTTMVVVPSMLSGLVERPSLHGKLRALRRVFSGGETLTPQLARRFFACMGPGAELVNLYGPTETTVFVSAWQSEPDWPAAALPVGHAIRGVQLHVLDGRLAPLPAGEGGELYVGGVGLARGYLNRPALTAARFIPDPFGHSGARLYRTGDLARRRPDGAVELLGRADSQVKLRGFRLELGEIEVALREQRGVREAVALLREDAPGEARLVGYVVPDPDEEVSAEALRRELERLMPDYMVPSHIALLPALPLTAHGKIDRSALPAPPERGLESDYVAPRTPLEEVLTGIVSDALDLERVGVRDPFFRLGLNSLQAARVAHETSDALGIHVSVGNIFLHDTVSSLIEALAPDGDRRDRLERTAALILRLARLTGEEVEKFEREL